MKTAKFGGSSLANSTQLKKVAEIIKADETRRFIVVSAPGKRFATDKKVTDLLVEFYQKRLKNEATDQLIVDIFKRYEEIGKDFQVEENILDQIYQSLNHLKELAVENNPHFLDEILSNGENNNAKLVAGVLQTEGVNARYIDPQELGIIVTDEPLNARILMSSYKIISRWRNANEVLVIPGFFGYTEKGDICTFSRGGSDITGAIVASAMNVDLYENFTDVNGIFAAHPGYIHHPEPIREITYREMRELSYGGFSVFHDEALMPSYRAKIPVVIKNTNNPDHPGTLITNERENKEQPVVGIASDGGFSMIYLNKYLMNREVGFTLKVLEIFKEFNLNYEHMPSGIDDISIILRANQLNPQLEEDLLRKIAYVIDPDELQIIHNLSMVMIVGEGMKQRVGSMAESTAALARKKINIEMISQGASEVSITFGVHQDREQDAIRTLYYTFFE
ncbi:aspartate kinase [Tetragenococcus koreensis]|uniref:Aspartokinase n=1 Tax=Tetragenococcus koreensis TaxID=290335 RepID=A0AAN4ZP97_9ENTE|nr:aspartate kinase [Tetragenococcus koreensis]MDN6590753.1 aspartate kinase [Lactobacillus sp.]AYW45605.1 aspartate kinase [Tetragenococcus koreensis]MCF1585269.1 aspartate kinase [Tetragenococcus koreensis]MCF1614220.1 aspartate kinase [Tetragenococcus koreensis]MCF1618028.1 aspartate kinase [Tetragenococcus koreensis]